MRRIATVALTAVVTLGSAAAGAVAAPADPRPQPVVNTDVFPGAQVGGPRTGPLATSVPSGVRTRGLVGGPFVGFTCDGTTGRRVEVMYVREASMPDRYAALQPIIQAWLLNADAAYNDGAAAAGRSRHIRYLTETVNGSCQAVVRNVVLPAGSLTTWDATIAAVQALGYTNDTRKYVMLTEHNSVCGLGSNYDDDRPGSENYNNNYATYARIDAIANCFGANAIAHEFGHTLGAVQGTAPHAIEPGHCSQRFDMMCYNETSSQDCPQWDQERLPDCGGDDYFNVAPASGNYLATHWNTANSGWLRAGTTADNQNYPRPGLTYTVTNVASGSALDIDPTTGSVNDSLKMLHAVAASGSASQKWLLAYQTGIQIMNSQSTMCVDTAFSGTAPGTQTLQYRCNGQDGMRWAYLPHSDGSFTVLNWLTGLALTQPTADNPLVNQQVYTGATNQRWFFTKLANPAPATTATVNYLTALSNRENIAVPTGAAVGTTITHAARGTATTQQWRLTAVGSYFQLVNIASGLCASNNQTTTEGLALTLQTCSTTLQGQQWALRRVADARYILVNRYSGRAAAMTTTAGSAMVQQAIDIDNRAQIFGLARV